MEALQARVLVHVRRRAGARLRRLHPCCVGEAAAQLGSTFAVASVVGAHCGACILLLPLYMPPVYLLECALLTIGLQGGTGRLAAPGSQLDHPAPPQLGWSSH